MSTGDFTLEVSPELLTGLLVGSTVDVSKFPHRKGKLKKHQWDPGKYYVDSVVLHCTGKIEIGLSMPPEKGDVIDDAWIDSCHIDYFEHDKLRLRVVSKGKFWMSAGS